MSAHHRARLGSPLRLKGSFELFGQSRKLVQKNIWIFAPLFALPLVFSFHSWEFGSGLSASAVPSYMWYGFVGFSFLWLVFVLAVGTVVQIMSQEAQLEATEGRPLDFIRLWGVVKETAWPMFGLYLLIGLYVFVGLILFIIPGLIMLRRYFLAPYVLLDTRCGVKEAMERSAEMSKPYSKYIWGVIGVMFLIGLFNVIPGVGWLVAFILGMYYSVAPALRYQELKEAHGGRSRQAHHEIQAASEE
jgi:uncharacterized membrane protein